MVQLAGQSKARRLSATLVAIVIATACPTASRAGEPGDRAKADGGLVIAVPALDSGDLQSQSGGRLWSPPAEFGSGDLSGRQMAIILWDDRKRPRASPATQPNQGVSMVNGRFQ